eukprot:gnl/Carplike_NY0171/15704_a23560_80.p1 GENE.gnl/Carplike_NY0171/15704_a23560_80~~gnl/Carplike_NY0171/15704_a23560_80.p1  ORF type:complete len:176 (-),score=13.57 gnl/Carplike_NY0171/15704_a23560_80:384-911(-)
MIGIGDILGKHDPGPTNYDMEYSSFVSSGGDIEIINNTSFPLLIKLKGDSKLMARPSRDVLSPQQRLLVHLSLKDEEKPPSSEFSMKLYVRRLKLLEYSRWKDERCFGSNKDLLQTLWKSEPEFIKEIRCSLKTADKMSIFYKSKGSTSCPKCYQLEMRIVELERLLMEEKQKNR